MRRDQLTEPKQRKAKCSARCSKASLAGPNNVKVEALQGGVVAAVFPLATNTVVREVVFCRRIAPSLEGSSKCYELLSLVGGKGVNCHFARALTTSRHMVSCLGLDDVA